MINSAEGLFNDFQRHYKNLNLCQKILLLATIKYDTNWKDLSQSSQDFWERLFMNSQGWASDLEMEDLRRKLLKHEF